MVVRHGGKETSCNLSKSWSFSGSVSLRCDLSKYFLAFLPPTFQWEGAGWADGRRVTYIQNILPNKGLLSKSSPLRVGGKRIKSLTMFTSYVSLFFQESF